MSKHRCQVLAISCIDFRFVSKVRDFLVGAGFKDNYDLITVPGASLGIDKAGEAISTSIRLHTPSEIYIFDHEDCGAYGEDDSRRRHVENLHKAKDLLIKNYPCKKVLIYIARFDKIEEVA